MALEKVFETLDVEGEKQRENLKVKADAEAVKILEEAEAEAKKLVQKHIEKMDASLRREKAKIEIEAELNKKRKIAKAKEGHTSKIFAEVENELAKIRNDNGKYKKVFKKLLEESLNEVSSKNITVVADKKDESYLKDLLREMKIDCEIAISDTPIDGLNLKVENSRIMVYNTFDSRLEKAKNVLKAQLTEVLFSDS